MTAWDLNREVLRIRFPSTARRVESAAAMPPFVERGEAAARRLAVRWLSGRRIRRGALAAISGFGDGTHVQLLLSVLPPEAAVFVAEREPGELRTTLERADLRAVLQDERLVLATGELDDAFFAGLKSLPLIEITDAVPLLFAPCYNRAPEYYARFFTEFARQVDFRRKLEGTRIVDAALWQANTFENLAALGDAPDVSALEGLFSGRAMVIVAAGPSLDESLEFLRTVEKTAVIVAVNSSYRAVRHAGVTPHFVLAADPRGDTVRGFTGTPLDRTWLVTTPIVHPEVVRLFAHRAFTWSGGNPLVTELRRRCGLPPGTMLVEQGTVSACAVDLATVLGCDRICLVGQDLAIRADGRSHAADSFYTDLGANRADVNRCRRLPGNTEPEVLVEEKLFVYLKTFEQLVVHRPHLRFRNTSRLGARIAGIPYSDFNDARRWIGRTPLAEPFGAIERRHREGRGSALDRAALVRVLAPTAEYARRVLESALRAAARCAALLEREGAIGDEPGIAAALAAVDELEERLQRDSSDYLVLESGRTRMELLRCRTNTAASRTDESVRAQLYRGHELAWAMAEGAWFLASQLQRFLADPAGSGAPGP